MLSLTLDKNSDVPLYLQASEGLCEAIEDGRLAPGDRLPPETALATELDINRLTVSRAYDCLKEKELLYQRRGSGTYITSDARTKLRRHNRPRVKQIAFVLGDKDLAVMHTWFQYIATAVLQGMQDAFGVGGADIQFFENYDLEKLGSLETYDGLVLHEYNGITKEVILEILQSGVPVAKTLAPSICPGIPSVTYNRRHAINMACEHLTECGYKRIGYIGVISDFYGPGEVKYAYFASALREHGLDLLARDTIHAHTDPGPVYTEMRKRIKAGDLPDAFFVDTDYKAIQVLHALQDNGVRVPEDIGIVSYDGIPESAETNPPLTTVDVPRREVGRRMAELFMDWPNDGTTPSNIILEAELRVRGSTIGIRT
jgi:DNA-binding LacI/PurR family transcriptional regulator